MDTRYFVFWAVGLLVAVYGSVLYKMPRDRGKSISQHIAQRKVTFLVTACAFSVYGALMYFFYVQWLQLALGLPFVFTLLVYLMTLGTFVTAWVPDSKKRLYQAIHRWAAYGSMAVVATLMLFVIGIFGELSVALHALTLLVGLFMVYCAVLYIFVKSARRHYLFYQISYALGFFVVLMAISLFHS